MLILKVKEGGIERALKMYKSKVIRTGMIKELRKRETFEKKSEQKRKQLLKARYIQHRYGD